MINNFIMKKSVKAFVAIMCLVNNLQPEDITFVRADQPVHCKYNDFLILFPFILGLRGQVYGVWNFHVNQSKEKVNLFQVDEVCTHKMPNK